MVSWLGSRPDQFCSLPTARAMAVAAFQRARKYGSGDAELAGIASTASLATDRAKRGPHRAHLALQTAACTATWSLEFQKQQRTRADEEDLVSRLMLNVVAAACGLPTRLELLLREGERIEHAEILAPQPWQDLLLGRTERVCQGQTPRPDAAIFPGAFNPLHAGHCRMVELAAELLGLPVALEISIRNPDKPPIDFLEIQRRLGQIPPQQPVWLTRAATFEEKSGLFPGATFIVGTDTLRRIASPRYYGDDPAACHRAIERMAAQGCRFLVFGRDEGASFTGLSDLQLPHTLLGLCRQVPAEQFRHDISSTAIRKSGQW